MSTELLILLLLSGATIVLLPALIWSIVFVLRKVRRFDSEQGADKAV